MSTQNNIIIKNNNDCAINEIRNNLINLEKKLNDNLVFNQVLQEFIVPYKRGQIVSCNKVADVNVGYSLYGPNQQVSVYKLVYYSNDSRTQTVERHSGALYIPSNITKNEIICNLKGTIPYMSDKALGYNEIQVLLNETDINKRSVITNCNVSLFLSGLGYVVLLADGNGYGESLGKPYYAEYDAEVDCNVDITRALRNLVIKKPELFNNRLTNKLSVLVTGYSEGAIFTSGYANTLVSDPNIEERTEFKIVKVVSGAIVNGYELYKYVLGTDVVSLSELFFITQAVNNININILYSKPNYIYNILPLFKDWSQDDINGFFLKLSTAVILDSIENPPVNNSYKLPVTTKLPGTQIDYVVSCDPKQFFDITVLNKYLNLLKYNSSYDNKFRPLTSLNNVPIFNIYSSKDELLNKNNVDLCAKYDQSLINLNKSVNVKNINADTVQSQSLGEIVNDIKTLSNNSYNRYVVNISDVNLQTHSNFFSVYLSIILNALK